MGKWIKKQVIMKKLNYKSAGVDIDAGNEAVDRIKDGVKSTFSSNVLTGLGSFGSLYNLTPIFKTYTNPVMVQSIDGVGCLLYTSQSPRDGLLSSMPSSA